MSEYRIGDRVRILDGHHYHPVGSEGIVVGLEGDWYDVEVEGRESGQFLIASEMEAL